VAFGRVSDCFIFNLGEVSKVDGNYTFYTCVINDLIADLILIRITFLKMSFDLI